MSKLLVYGGMIMGELESKMVKCKLCGGEGFIYMGPVGSPCPECWGSGKVAEDE